MTDLPDVKLKAVVQFPASIVDGVGTDVTKLNGKYRIDLAYDDFTPPLATISDPANTVMLVWNTVSQAYGLAPTSLLLGSGSTFPSDVTPLAPGTAVPGISVLYARGDHVHPTDNGKVSKSGDTMTGPLGIGVAPAAKFSVSDGSAYGTDVDTWGLQIASYSSDPLNAGALYLTRARGTLTALLPPNVDDKIGLISFFGRDATTWNGPSEIVGQVDATVTAGSLPIALSFKTGTSGGGSERLRIASNGKVTLTSPVSIVDANQVATKAYVDSVGASAVSPSALTRTNDTNVTLTLGGTPATALLQATSITAGWSGTLATTRGGWGLDISSSSGVPLFVSGTPTFTAVTGTGSFVCAVSPTFTGDPKAPTPTAGDNDTSIATTAFVTSAVSTGVTGLATIASPTFTGDPKAPTPTAGDNDTSIATTAFVTAAVPVAATAAEYISNSAPTKMLTPGAPWSAAAPVALSGASVTPNLSAGIDFTWTMSSATSTLVNPTSPKPGQKGMLYLVQDATGSRIITSWGSFYKFPGGTKPTLSTAANAIDVISFAVKSTTEVECFFASGMA
jgi:hypothetical protein